MAGGRLPGRAAGAGSLLLCVLGILQFVVCRHYVTSSTKWHADTLECVQINRDGEPMRAAHFNFKVLDWLLCCSSAFHGSVSH